MYEHALEKEAMSYTVPEVSIQAHKILHLFIEETMMELEYK